MGKDNADIVGSIGSQFKVTISPDDPTGTTGIIENATLKRAGQPDKDLPFSEHEVTLADADNLVSGDSLVVLSILWGPGDADAIIDVGTVISGEANPANPKHFIQVDDVPGFIQLFGE